MMKSGMPGTRVCTKQRDRQSSARCVQVQVRVKFENLIHILFCSLIFYLILTHTDILMCISYT